MKYPKGVKINSDNNVTYNHIPVSYKNRGMDLEALINETNNYYIEKGIAYIYKKPTPIKLVSVDYKKAKINEAYFMEPSTTDYNGLWNGKYVDFEAKETVNNTSFPIKNIHDHQIKHIINIYNNDGICFLIIKFKLLNETYLLFAEDFINFLNNNKRSSIPHSYFVEKGHLIKDKFIPSIDYISILESLGGKNE